jgi:hypothetical protein
MVPCGCLPYTSILTNASQFHLPHLEQYAAEAKDYVTSPREPMGNTEKAIEKLVPFVLGEETWGLDRGGSWKVKGSSGSQ